MTIDRPEIFEPAISGIVFLGRNDAPPDNDTTTASNGCAAGGSARSQTATRSFSITGFSAVCETACETIAKSSRMRTIETTSDYEVYRSITSFKRGARPVSRHLEEAGDIGVASSNRGKS